MENREGKLKKVWIPPELIRHGAVEDLTHGNYRGKQQGSGDDMGGCVSNY